MAEFVENFEENKRRKKKKRKVADEDSTGNWHTLGSPKW
jgi:hypothetical protein